MIPRLECQNFKGGPRVRDFRRSLGPLRKKKGARERAGSFSEQRLVMEPKAGRVRHVKPGSPSTWLTNSGF